MPRQPSAQDLQLAAQFCPVVVFDSKEQIRPMRMQEYVEQCSVHDLRTDAVLQESTQPGIDVQLAHRSDVYLHLNHASWRRMDADDVQDVPFYVKVDRDVVHHGRNCISIVYMFFYPHDYGGLELHGKRYGEHVADLEHVRVLVSATEPHTIVRVHYAAHGFFEGRWMEPSELQYHDNDTRKRAMVYVACNGHGSYPHPGKYVRLFGIAPDKMDGKGRRWNVNGLVEGYPDVLLGYRGKLSREILNAPCQEWWHEVEPEVTRVCRFTGGFVNVFAKRNERHAVAESKECC